MYGSIIRAPAALERAARPVRTGRVLECGRRALRRSDSEELNMGDSKFMTWQVGAVRVTRVRELGGEPFPGSFLFPDASAALIQRHAWLKPHFAHEDGRLFGSIHSFVIESGERRIIVDTCVGNDKPRTIRAWNLMHGPFLQDLAQAGFPPDSIDTVLCTHLHVDHVGWNTRLVNGKWIPTFPNARYLFGRKEWEHWSAEEGSSRDVIGDSVRPVVDAGLVQLVEMDHALTDEVRLEPTPGHTPGHVSVHISSRGEHAVITGDIMHHPLQCAEPDLANNFDSDASAARRTRREFLERYANRPTLVLGTHFAPPTGGWIVAADKAWRLALTPPADADKS
jgi:glyoxylase-like metal-dependent hydrolase (beta-lactamase superfamily II)